MDSLLTAPLVAKQSTDSNYSVCYYTLYLFLIRFFMVIGMMVNNQTHFIALSLFAAVHVGCSDLPLCQTLEGVSR